MKPILVDDKCYLICNVRTSTVKEVGHLCVYNKNGWIYKEYQHITKRWKTKTKTSLTECEKAILILAQQGESCKDIANVLCKSQSTIHNQMKSLFSKLDVHSMQEAIEFASYHQLIYLSQDMKHQSMFVEDLEDLQQRVQQHLTNDISVRKVARLENVAESTIRYWIKKGKVK